MSSDHEGNTVIQSENDIAAVRRIIRKVATDAGFGVTDVTRIVTATSELARNIIVFAESGMLMWRVLQQREHVGVELVFEDHGPGIDDVTEAMRLGYTTAGGLGLGLPGSKRLMDEMDLWSEVGQGTRVTVRKWRKT